MIKTKTPQSTIESIVADIRNKLTPFWTLATLANEQMPLNGIEKIIKQQATNAEAQKSAIISDLDRILLMTKKKSRNRKRTAC